ncbi:hypothetical protein E5720_06115 [Rhodococcus sp. PAMC28707]|uniref:hypothetical protein n=1 Tax=unclassified Rhodococcus (in: high G+C Gram-positive bacteria) TaxID=192944 RepID=UPI00109DF690|nr:MULTISPECIES: hypothetical protein [unclassified Rhodococcus (in: high G+C Gram-positive bacteria)]QCB50164.1 hypothetical protein E5769_07900 [Rhodococcus sp. PAMC28705]QCB58143.1 hypothetical protein E5720_06115 [Rhodococcus sp. PAMC28707]
MSRTAWKSTVAGLAVGALTVTGALSGAGAAAADAAHPTSNTVVGGNVKISKEVVGDGTVAAGGKVTLRTSISSTGHPERYINRITDRAPAGFKYVQDSARVNAWHLIGGQSWEKVTPSVDVNANTVSVPDAGWLISPTGSKTVTFEATYLAPNDAQKGAFLETSVDVDVSTFASTQKLTGVFVEIRDQNPGEAITSGSADLGFGSSDGEGGTGSAGSSIIENPSDFIGDIISRILQNGTGS